ncbi:Broad specificity phosphatase PhoE [Pseudooceanicola antarcticus]|uniref:Broad specificity phosphatase PhoE n=1 Tax=Pseudooceanicola antarcticus TaxID=1247613 RepID=A0A285HKH1_9RHOB|nr:histidine phosphatase family protein [Pseudooceanicola antarcticus]PJE27886.1 histidine phosphatase family protein [Pseudooceanicola antarcticus]SNY36215.1 Broad specificity phosphatase PhoE [Pseudooceanicola antarcticus]
MGTLYLIRHGQASFGAADYDVLSETGHAQANALGRWFAAQGIAPDRLAHGGLRRQRETLESILKGMGSGGEPDSHPGLSEFDFKALLDARFAEAPAPQGLHDDRRSHFRTLRDTVLMWQRGEILNPPETWESFTSRVEAARAHLMREGAETVFAVSSGGAISQMIAATLGAPGQAQIELQLQTRNCAVARFVFGRNRHFLNGFNETPFLTSPDDPLLTYS